MKEGNIKSRKYAKNRGAEICMVVLLLVTICIVSWRHALFDRDLVIDQHSALRYILSGYSDHDNGGASTISLARRPLDWTCDLKSQSAIRYCGYQIIFDDRGAKPGLDLSKLEAVRLTIDYHGPATTLRVFLKNRDPIYSHITEPRNDKVNTTEFSVVEGRQTIVIQRDDFSVADWWLVGKPRTRALQRTQFDRVVSVDLASGTTALAARYSVVVESLVLSRSIVTPTRLYLIIIVVWAILLGIYICLRVREKVRTEGQIREAMAAAKQAAEQASQAKSEFLAHMSHELRTPLNGVLGFSGVLEQSGLTDAQRVAVRAIRHSGEHLLALINDSLDLSKIEAGKMELFPAPMDIRSVMASVAEMLCLRAEERGLAFRCEVGADVPAGIMADEQRLRQVLLNFLSNAVKFTNQGSVSLLVTRLAGSSEPVTLRFEVEDTGPGITEEGLARIFKPYEQVGDVERRKSGTGLGLTISQRFVELMGATIQVRSRIGEGTCFWFDASFPVCEPPAVRSSRRLIRQIAPSPAG